MERSSASNIGRWTVDGGRFPKVLHEIYLRHLLTSLFARPDHKILGVALDRSRPADGRGARLFSFGQYHQHRCGLRFIQEQQRVFYRHLMRCVIVRAGSSFGPTRAWRVRSSEVALVATEFLA